MVLKEERSHLGIISYHWHCDIMMYNDAENSIGTCWLPDQRYTFYKVHLKNSVIFYTHHLGHYKRMLELFSFVLLCFVTQILLVAALSLNVPHNPGILQSPNVLFHLTILEETNVSFLKQHKVEWSNLFHESESLTSTQWMFHGLQFWTIPNESLRFRIRCIRG